MTVDHLYQHGHTPENIMRKSILLLQIKPSIIIFNVKKSAYIISYLMVTFNRFWQRMMNDKTDIGFVDTWSF